MAKTYDIGDSASISRLRNSTLGSGPVGTVGKKKKPTLAQQIFPDETAYRGNAAGNAFAQGLWQGGVAGTDVWGPPPQAQGAAPGAPLGTGPAATQSPAGPPGDFDLSQPGMYEQWIGQHLGDFTAPTNSQGVFDKGAFNKPLDSETHYAANKSAYNTPGAMENWDASHSAEFDKSRQQEDYWNDVKGERANMPQVSNRAEEAYQHTKANLPDISTDAGLDPYYKNAREVGTRSLNSQLAARGAYGSSVGLGQIGNMLQGLGAEQANRESQYHLDRMAEQRGWEGLQGQLAQGADSSSGRIHDAKLSDLLGFGTLANNAGNARLASLIAGGNSAATAQNAENQRWNTGISAAGQSSDAALARQGLGLQAAGQADSQRLAGLTAGGAVAQGGQAARGNRIQGAFNNVSSVVDAALKTVGPIQAQQIQADYRILDDKTMAKAARVAAAQRIADAAANGDKELGYRLLGLLTAGIA